VRSWESWFLEPARSAVGLGLAPAGGGGAARVFPLIPRVGAHGESPSRPGKELLCGAVRRGAGGLGRPRREATPGCLVCAWPAVMRRRERPGAVAAQVGRAEGQRRRDSVRQQCNGHFFFKPKKVLTTQDNNNALQLSTRGPERVQTGGAAGRYRWRVPGRLGWRLGREHNPGLGVREELIFATVLSMDTNKAVRIPSRPRMKRLGRKSCVRNMSGERNRPGTNTGWRRCLPKAMCGKQCR